MSKSTTAPDIGMSAAKRGTSSASPGIAGVIVTRAAGLAAAWGTQRLLKTAFRKRAGHEPPDATDVRTPVLSVIGWSVVTAASLAAVQVVVDRWSARRLLPEVADQPAPAPADR